MMLFEVEYGLSDRAPEVDIIGSFKGCFYQILLWLINRVAIACKPLKGKGTYRQNFNKVEPKTKHYLPYWCGSVTSYQNGGQCLCLGFYYTSFSLYYSVWEN